MLDSLMMCSILYMMLNENLHVLCSTIKSYYLLPVEWGRLSRMERSSLRRHPRYKLYLCVLSRFTETVNMKHTRFDPQIVLGNDALKVRRLWLPSMQIGEDV